MSRNVQTGDSYVNQVVLGDFDVRGWAIVNQVRSGHSGHETALGQNASLGYSQLSIQATP